MKIKTCRFERSAVSPEDEPRAPGPDVVFLGRSNVGKSSLINRLLGAKNLARTSSVPGRTQVVNFYRVNESFHFVDLPGYGYAKVPEAERRKWGPMVESFLERRRDRIVMGVLVLDARHRPTKLDLTMRDWLDWKNIPYLLAATKADKLSGNGRTAAVRELQRAIGASPHTGPAILVSAKTGLGAKTVWRWLDEAISTH